jgi:hypothetical protein
VERNVVRDFFDAVVGQARAKGLLSDEHFTVDGTLIEAWASLKSFKPKDGSPPREGGDGSGMVDFQSQKRSNAAHESSTDPGSKLMRKGDGQPAKLIYGGHALMENRAQCSRSAPGTVRLTGEPVDPTPRFVALASVHAIGVGRQG